MGATDTRVHIEVAHGGEEEVVVIPLAVTAGTTAAQAIRQSGILDRFPALDPERNGIGIFGRLVSPETVVAGGDRVEIYRPLKADPREVRRRRAARQRRESR